MTPTPRLVLFVVCATVFGGCFMVGPNYVAPTASKLGVPSSWRATAPSSESGADVATWWQQLGDSMLTKLIAEAVQSSPDVESARARLREARARRSLSSADLWPTIGGTASARRTKSSAATGGSGDQNRYDAGFDASWEVDVFGGQRRALEAARADEEGAFASVRDARVTLAAEVARTYVEARAFQARIAIARANLASQSETLDLTEWRVEAGLASAVDSEQARTQVQQTRASIPPLATSLAEAQYRLAVLLGRAPAALADALSPSAPLPQIPDPLTVGIPADILRRRPDVSAAERTLAAETARVGEATAERYPTLTLSGSLGLESLALAGLTSGGSLAASAAGSIAQTIFDAGRISARIEIQNAVQEQAWIAYRKSVLTALEEVENALVALANNRERAAAFGEAARSARNASLLARNRYSAGLIDFQTVLDTERTVLTNEDGLQTAQADAAVAGIQLYKALGGGWSGTDEAEPS